MIPEEAQAISSSDASSPVCEDQVSRSDDQTESKDSQNESKDSPSEPKGSCDGSQDSLQSGVPNERLPITPAFALPGNQLTYVQRRRFIVDTGASYHLISRNNLSSKELPSIFQATPIAIKTANGIVTTSEAILIKVHLLGNESLQFYVLDDAVDVVSIGLLVKQGWAYNHTPGDKPMLTKPGRKTVVCEELQNVPILAIAKCSEEFAAPAPHHVPEQSLEEAFEDATTEDLPSEEIIEEESSATPIEGEPSSTDVVCQPCIPASHWITHFPKHKDCPICNQVKMQFSQHRSKQQPASRHVAEDDTEQPKEFGDQQTCDHIILGKGEESVLHDKAALVCLDRGTRYMDSFPDETNDYDCS